MNPSTPGLLCDLGRVTEAWSSISWVGTPSFPQSHGGREMVGSPTAAWVHSRLSRKISAVKLCLL